ncbi:hypothetical protein PLESTM_001084300 [Pleodorina starrii]|nr:hypothetical protein PLESTM_001084300 [Pleodorina starrii]
MYAACGSAGAESDLTGTLAGMLGLPDRNVTTSCTRQQNSATTRHRRRLSQQQSTTEECSSGAATKQDITFKVDPVKDLMALRSEVYNVVVNLDRACPLGPVDGSWAVMGSQFRNSTRSTVVLAESNIAPAGTNVDSGLKDSGAATAASSNSSSGGSGAIGLPVVIGAAVGGCLLLLVLLALAAVLYRKHKRRRQAGSPGSGSIRSSSLRPTGESDGSSSRRPSDPDSALSRQTTQDTTVATGTGPGVVAVTASTQAAAAATGSGLGYAASGAGDSSRGGSPRSSNRPPSGIMPRADGRALATQEEGLLLMSGGGGNNSTRLAAAAGVGGVAAASASAEAAVGSTAPAAMGDSAAPAVTSMPPFKRDAAAVAVAFAPNACMSTAAATAAAPDTTPVVEAAVGSQQHRESVRSATRAWSESFTNQGAAVAAAAPDAAGDAPTAATNPAASSMGATSSAEATTAATTEVVPADVHGSDDSVIDGMTLKHPAAAAEPSAPDTVVSIPRPQPPPLPLPTSDAHGVYAPVADDDDQMSTSSQPSRLVRTGSRPPGTASVSGGRCSTPVSAKPAADMAATAAAASVVTPVLHPGLAHRASLQGPVPPAAGDAAAKDTDRTPHCGLLLEAAAPPLIPNRGSYASLRVREATATGTDTGSPRPNRVPTLEVPN